MLFCGTIVCIFQIYFYLCKHSCEFIFLYTSKTSWVLYFYVVNAVSCRQLFCWDTTKILIPGDVRVTNIEYAAAFLNTSPSCVSVLLLHMLAQPYDNICPSYGSSILMGVKSKNTRLLRFRCMLKIPVVKTQPYFLAMACFLIMWWFLHAKPRFQRNFLITPLSTFKFSLAQIKPVAFCICCFLMDLVGKSFALRCDQYFELLWYLSREVFVSCYVYNLG